MAKRFTDTEKWFDSWYSNLDPFGKLLWGYVLDRCDHAGIFEPNLKDINYFTGSNHASLEEIIKILEDRIITIQNGKKWFIPKFITFQYTNTLSNKNKAVAKVISRIEEYDLLKFLPNIKIIDGDFGCKTRGLQGANKGLDSTYQGVKEEEEEKEEEQVQEEVFFNDVLSTNVVLSTKEETETKKDKEPHRQGLNKYTGRNKENYFLSDEELETRLNELLKLNPKEVENTDYEVIKYLVNKKLEEREGNRVNNSELDEVVRWIKNWGLVKVADILNEANLCKFKNLGTLKNKLDKQGNITGDKQFTNSDRPFTGVREVESTPLKMKSKSKIDTDDQQIQGASGW
jgi:hypothetical protein